MYLDEITLPTENLPALAEFYQQTLGLPVTRQGESELLIQAGATRLVFQQAPSGWRGMYHFAFNIPPNLFDDARRWLEERAALIPDEQGLLEFSSSSAWDSRSCYFYDPAGNILELVARQRLDNPASPAFDASYILNISEIGLASEDVPALAQRLSNETGLTVFGGEIDRDFTPLGDDHGLLILVRHGRKWYPNRRDAAELLPIQITMHSDSGAQISLRGVPYRIEL